MASESPPRSHDLHFLILWATAPWMAAVSWVALGVTELPEMRGIPLRAFVQWVVMWAFSCSTIPLCGSIVVAVCLLRVARPRRDTLLAVLIFVLGFAALRGLYLADVGGIASDF